MLHTSRFALALILAPTAAALPACLDFTEPLEDDQGDIALFADDAVQFRPVDVRIEGQAGPVDNVDVGGRVDSAWVSSGSLGLATVGSDGRVMTIVDLYNFDVDAPDATEGYVTGCADAAGNEEWGWDVTTEQPEDTEVVVEPCGCDNEDLVDVTITARLVDYETGDENVLITQVRVNKAELREATR
jgi:hypothetical protein